MIGMLERGTCPSLVIKQRVHKISSSLRVFKRTIQVAFKNDIFFEAVLNENASLHLQGGEKVAVGSWLGDDLRNHNLPRSNQVAQLSASSIPTQRIEI
jgi:hypothetical protein